MMMVNEQRCALFYDTVRAPRGWDHILARILGLRLCGFFLNNRKAQLNFLFKRAVVDVSAGGGGGDGGSGGGGDGGGDG